MQYEQNALTGAAEVQAAEFERMQRIVHAGQLVVRLVKSHVLDGILVVEGLDDDFADVPAYSVPDRKSGKDANRQRPNHISAERADIEADQETRGQQAAEKIQRMLNDCPVGDDESFAAEQQRFVTVVQTLWNSLSAEFPDDLPPRLAYERANAGPTAEIAA
ncbi:MAG: hypothetical protein K8T89_13030, partial [Planctomycetes bacterium]|nr:hypothetical protein [Planctomycetota bacterium]